MKNFMGKDGFTWFVGVVEDRQDPKTLGRVRVRCLGYHTEDIIKLPTSDLPWAHPMNPITSATVSGVGQTPLGVVEGTWVVGFFTDIDKQQPMIMGTLPGVPSTLPVKDAKKGFQDYSNANYPKYTETDVNRLAVNEKTDDVESNPHSTLTLRRADRDLAVVLYRSMVYLRVSHRYLLTLTLRHGTSHLHHTMQPIHVIMYMRARAAT